MRIKTKYAPDDIVIVNKTRYQILSVRTNSNCFGSREKINYKISYHIQNKHGEGCEVLEQMIEKKVTYNIGSWRGL